jgi:hypothetical protein
MILLVGAGQPMMVLSTIIKGPAGLAPGGDGVQERQRRLFAAGCGDR